MNLIYKCSIWLYLNKRTKVIKGSRSLNERTTISTANTLRIDYSMRYNIPNITVRTGVQTTHTHLTQPTDDGGELGWQRFYHKPVSSRPGGIPSGHFVLVESENQNECLTKEQNMSNRNLTRQQVIRAIATLRQDWEASAEGSLLGIEGSVGLILSDIVNLIGLKPEEQIEALGQQLYLDCCAVEVMDQSITEWVPESWESVEV
jgi:hypothetical protein